MDVKDAGRKGGDATKDKYGSDHYANIGARGGKRLSEERGPDYFKELGKKGAAKTKALIDAGKKAAAAEAKEAKKKHTNDSQS